MNENIYRFVTYLGEKIEKQNKKEPLWNNSGGLKRH